MSTANSENWPSIDALEAQEHDLVLERADLASLQDLGRLMSKAAEERDLPVVIQIAPARGSCTSLHSPAAPPRMISGPRARHA